MIASDFKKALFSWKYHKLYNNQNCRVLLYDTLPDLLLAWSHLEPSVLLDIVFPQIKLILKGSPGIKQIFRKELLTAH